MKQALVCTLWFTLACSNEARLFSRKDVADAAAQQPDAASPAEAAVDAGDVATDAAPPPAKTRLVVHAGFDHACAIRDGKLFCWGDGQFGKLGLGDDVGRNVPTRVDARTDWVSVAVGEQHTCAIAEDKSVHCWGRNLKGELGLGDFSPRNRPTLVPGLSLVRLESGGQNTCGIGVDEHLVCWGHNFEGKIGLSDPFDSPDVPTPTPVMTDLHFSAVSVGQGHVCAISVDGALFCWGRNTDGQLGIDTMDAQIRTPTRVGSRTYRRIAAAQRHSCAIDVTGSLFCWGTDSEGSLGINLVDAIKRAPQPVSPGVTFEDVSVMWFHTCAIRSPSELYCWGRNAEGQLGVGDIMSRAVPTRVGLDASWMRISTGHFHTCGVRENALYCWGENNAYGQLGLGDSMRRNVPTLVSLP